MGAGPTDDALAVLETAIGHVFTDRQLLVEALTHASHGPSAASYERLEFLGDRVLGLVLAEHFFSSCPQDDEGGCRFAFMPRRGNQRLPPLRVRWISPPMSDRRAA